MLFTMSASSSSTLDKLREEAAKKALWELETRVIPDLELVIAGTPTGPVRNKLTEASIILHSLLK